MRIVTKINLSLAGVVGISALLNLAALSFTVMPRFVEIESETATRNQMRVLEAITSQEDQVAASSRDYAFWDDSYAYMNGVENEYEAKNVNADSIEALRVNYFLAIDPSGSVVLDKGFDFSGDEARDLQLLDTKTLPADHPFMQPFAEAGSRTGLLRTEVGIVAVGYAPILTSERTGDVSGTLLFGRILDLEALREMTKVEFDLVPLADDTTLEEGSFRRDRTIETRTVLTGIDGAPLALLTSRTNQAITSAGQQAVWSAMGLLVLGGLVLIATLAFVLRRIAVRRIEAMRTHLNRIASTGSMEAMPDDGHDDELSQTRASFNVMASQLAELRETLRRQDYQHGAADQAAGLLHNVRNAVSPIGTIAWDLSKAEEAPWKQNLGKALQELSDPTLAPERALKLNQFVAMSAGKFLDEAEKRQVDLRSLNAMVRHVDNILKDEDVVSRGARQTEVIDVEKALVEASKLVGRRPAIAIKIDVASEFAVLGHRIAFEQILGNLFVNAAEAIEACDRGTGTISVSVIEVEHRGARAIDIMMSDDGDGIPVESLDVIFEKGFSTRRERSGGLGLHWCANAVNAMNGRMFAHSEGPGRGATLHLVLPAAEVALRNAA